MKKEIALGLAISFILLATPILADIDDIRVLGNASDVRNYYYEYLNVSTMNTSKVHSWGENFYIVAFNISNNATSGDNVTTMTDLNITLGDQRATETTSKIRLLNQTRELIMTANLTYADGNYTAAWFNLTNIATWGNASYGCIDNKTNTTFIVEYRLKPLDSNASTVSTIKDIWYTENRTYPGPTDLNYTNVTLAFEPAQAGNIEYLKTVQYDGTTVTNYTFNDSQFVLYDPILLNGTTHWLYVEYSVPESGKGGTGAGGTRPAAVTLPAPGVSTTFWVVAIWTAVIAIGAPLAYYGLKKR